MDDLGRLLKEQRIAKGITLEQMQQRTRIRLAYLQAIEDGQWHRLPGPVYVKAFLRHYSRLVELDENEIIQNYEKNFQPEEESVSPVKEQLELPVNPWFLLLLSVMLVGSLYLGARMFMNRNAPKDKGYDTVQTVTGKGLEFSNVSHQMQDEDTNEDSPSVVPAMSIIDNSLSEQILSGSFVVVEGNESASLMVEDSNSHTATYSNLSPNGFSPTAPNEESIKLNLIIYIYDECWVEAWVDQTRVVYRTMQKGESVTLHSREGIQIRLGRAENVRLVLNGEDLGVAGIGVRTLDFTPELE